MLIKKLSLLGFAVLFSIGVSGCAVVLAAKQPGRKNLSVLSSGTPRDNVITYLGAPANTELKEGERVDIYQFKQGYSGGAKASRALFHGAADVFTFGLWEVVGTPAELIFDGTETTVKVMYDKEDKVKDVTYLKR